MNSRYNRIYLNQQNKTKLIIPKKKKQTKHEQSMSESETAKPNCKFSDKIKKLSCGNKNDQGDRKSDNVVQIEPHLSGFC
jgi:hypothetical protein